ncbi:MAG: Gfo/Idh/MocA family oxidoreductase [Bacteroidales bacterium]|jgi:predicted dehydrogenase|nr:Gfo/Idh/MocA family oxidoreductase [Bacteroidales bacterium]
MSNNRRDFLKTITLGTGLIATGVTAACSISDRDRKQFNRTASQDFNMCGYRAPSIDRVRIGFIGLGMRGPGAVMRMAHIEGVEIAALCNKYTDRVEATQGLLAKNGLPRAKSFSGSEDAWKELCEAPDIDLVYICTPWSYHTPMAVYAMENNKHAAVEVPAAKTIDECWQLVETSEKTRKHCMMLENCCYDFFELLTLNMARNGFFGEIVHGEGAYIHDLRFLNFDKEGYADMWRLKENTRNGNLYPTHGLGPVCQIMNINRGDQMDYLTSMSGKDFQMQQRVNELAREDSFFEPFAGKDYRGNMNSTLIRTHKGRTIMVQHDVTSPRPYSRIHLVSGTQAMARKWPYPPKIARGHQWLTEKEIRELEQKYTPRIVQRVGEMAKKIGGHGGMDFIMDWRLIDCLRNGLPLDQDVYDAALWSAIAPLSEWSVAHRSDSIDVPDFTRGAWKKNNPVDISLAEGGSTGVKNLQKESRKVQLEV